MRSKLAVLVISGMLLTAFASYAFAQCGAAKEAKKQSCQPTCQCCGSCDCGK
jgi:hypothetical protein